MMMKELIDLIAHNFDAVYTGMQDGGEIDMVRAIAYWLHDPEPRDPTLDIEHTAFDIKALSDALSVTHEQLCARLAALRDPAPDKTDKAVPDELITFYDPYSKRD